MLQGFGLTYPQFLVLVALREKDGRTIGEVGNALFLESNTLTPLLKRMEGAGMVSRRRGSDDERVVRVYLLRAGSKLLDDLGCVPPQVLDAAHMPLGEIAILAAKLTALSAHVRGAASV